VSLKPRTGRLAPIKRIGRPLNTPTEPVEFELVLRFYDGFVARIPQLLRSEYAAPQ
jgi:hypothetical protein